jgi:chromosome segregation ATPase
MTEANESIDRLTRLERLMEQQIINTADLTQQIKEVSTQIKAQATFHDSHSERLRQRFERSLSATRQLIDSNAKAISANSTSIESERKAIRELRRSIRESRLDNLVGVASPMENRHREHQERANSLYDAIEDLQEDIKEIGRKIDRQNPPD